MRNGGISRRSCANASRMNGRPILTAAATRQAEQNAIKVGISEDELMERAGRALAEAIFRFAGTAPALILCGPGNNGGDGYVAARELQKRGIRVRIAALSDPKSDAARKSRSLWGGEVESLNSSTRPESTLIDCLFGTGLSKGLAAPISKEFTRICDQSLTRIACDLPSGIETDSGAELSDVRPFDMTVSFGALKPAHRLYPGIDKCGRVVLAEIGIEAETKWHEIPPPELPALDPGGHKYDRGLVHALAGKMPGAIALAVKAASRAGAGYVRVSTSKIIEGLYSAIVQIDTAPVNDERIGCILVGPGMGDIPQLLTLALTSKAPKVVDADAISHLGDPERLRGQDAILTPHEGEFHRLFGDIGGNKVERALEAARLSGAVLVYKGADTIVASPDGRVGFRAPSPPWLASAGTGDVLAGLIAAMRARGLDGFDAATAGVWLHSAAAGLAGPNMIADDLVDAVPGAITKAGELSR